MSGTEGETDPSVLWTGRLTRGDAPGTVVGFLLDSWNWRVEITGTLDPEGGYRLEGRLGPVPYSLRVEAIDDPITKNGEGNT
jgi:hypothetical protein